MKVLIVDNNPQDLQSLSGMLESCTRERFFVTRAPNGQYAKEACMHDNPYDIILYDHNVSDVSAISFLGWLRDNGKRIPTVLITGHGELSIQNKASQIGFAGFVEKGPNLTQEKLVDICVQTITRLPHLQTSHPGFSALSVSLNILAENMSSLLEGQRELLKRVAQPKRDRIKDTLNWITANPVASLVIVLVLAGLVVLGVILLQVLDLEKIKAIKGD